MSLLRVLLVEDTPQYIELTQQFLEPYNRYSVSVVSFVADFKACVNASAFDVILLDYQLPDGTGLDVLTYMSEHDIKTPVVVVTGRGDEQVAVRMVQAGAAEYVVKAGAYLDSLPVVIDRVYEQSRLKRELDEARQRYRDLFAQAAEGILIGDQDGRIIDVNPVLCQWLKLSPAELKGHTLAAIDGESNGGASLLDVSVRQNSASFERALRRADGTSFPAEINAHFDRSGAGQRGVMQLLIRDITQRRHMELENARLIRELRGSVETLKQMQAQLVQTARFSAVGELAVGIAHQINNPLTTILADIQLLTSALGPNHPGHDSAAAIHEAGWRAQKVVQRLVNFADPGKDQLAPTDINDTIMSALDLTANQLDNEALDLRLNLAAGLPEILANAVQIEELWINLLINAREALRPDRPGRIGITSQLLPGGEAVQVTVSDNGRGVRPEDQQYLFTPFFTTKGDSRGNGLGLSVCQAIVRHHHGDISFETQSGHGTTFIVTLPARQPA